ncbi:MAG: CDP-alcohol phosphatidyltransferase family protein [Candidatus Poribacteria bacterium]|nr:CDP-alcohol phosphatidyltransferase family protein [Candidatus Poribacteria bacterium]
MLANTITIACPVLTFAVMALFGHQRALSIALIFTIALIFALDAVDGYIARKRNKTSKLGEILDTLADRIEEGNMSKLTISEPPLKQQSANG